MASISWNNGTLGFWSTATDWTPGLPGPSDDVVIDQAIGSIYTVVEDSITTISNLTLGSVDSEFSPTLLFASGATLTVTNSFINEGNVVLGAGEALTFATLVNDGRVTLNGGDLNSEIAGSLLDNGLIEGTGTIDGTLTGTGIIDARGGRLELTGSVASADLVFQIEDGSTLALDQSVLTSSRFAFMGTTGELNVPTGFGGIIAGMNVGSSGTVPTTILDINADITSGHIAGTNLLLYSGTTLVATEQLATSFVNGTKVIVEHVAPGDTNIFFSSLSAPCYAAGTRILTPDGEKCVEDLREGDQVIVVSEGGSAPVPVKWIGYRNVDLARHPRPDLAAPVRIRRHAMGQDQPHRDLLVSPDHCVFIGDKLIPARMLVNDLTITQEYGLPDVLYFHIELDRHGILLAEGLPAESYLDTGNRACFANTGLAMLLHPEFRINDSLRTRQDACAPLEVDPETVRPVWETLADRAACLGFTPRQTITDSEPDLRVVVSGKTIRAVERVGERHSFVLPAGTRRITLLSRASRPSETHRYLDDRRNIGVAVASVTLRAGDDFIVFPADRLPAEGGWHVAETVDGRCWRWTNGAGVLQFDPLPAAAILDIRLGGWAMYVVEQPPARLSA